MAGDWIKMRGGLFHSPKLIAISKALEANKRFCEWAIPSNEVLSDEGYLSDGALRCVTGALLCVTWSWSREFGKPLDNGDCYLSHVTISDIDSIAGAPGLGEAMRLVGWAKPSSDGCGVVLPKFFAEHNLPISSADKQKAYRERKKSVATVTKRVTKSLPTPSNDSLPEKSRVEKSREENTTDILVVPTNGKKAAGYSPEYEKFWLAVAPHKRDKKTEGFRRYKEAISVLSSRSDIADPHDWLLAKATEYYLSPLGQSKYANGPAPWLHQGGYDADSAAWKRGDDTHQSKQDDLLDIDHDGLEDRTDYGPGGKP